MLSRIGESFRREKESERCREPIVSLETGQLLSDFALLRVFADGLP